MSVTVRAGRPDSPEGTALLRASQAYLAALYPAEHNHYLSIEALCAPHVRFFVAEDVASLRSKVQPVTPHLRHMRRPASA